MDVDNVVQTFFSSGAGGPNIHKIRIAHVQEVARRGVRRCSERIVERVDIGQQQGQLKTAIRWGDDLNLLSAQIAYKYGDAARAKFVSNVRESATALLSKSHMALLKGSSIKEQHALSSAP